MIRFIGMTINRMRADKGLRLAQDRIDSACIEQMKPYVPVAKSIYRNAGKMRDSHKTERPGVIINTEPKARREYYINKGGSGGLRGKFWFERMKVDHKRDILKAAQEEL